MKSANKMLPDIVDNANNPIEITELFKRKYSKIYQSVPTSDTELGQIICAIDEKIDNFNHIDCTITPILIRSCIMKLKSDKSDGDLGFNSNHLINGSKRLHVMLSILFNAMLFHGYYPDELLKSTIISIPKDKSASLCNSNNYRGISLFNSISKLYDYVIIELCGDRLLTSDMQFGYKENHSTTMCTAIFREVIEHYVNGHSNVYSCLLDASKAFDKIHYGKLFKVLLSKNIDPHLIRIILNSYIRQKSRVSWGDHMSPYFSLANGVKQGGVASAIFFTLYIDSLLIQLKESGYGCYIDGIFIGALSYADDITLISPSIRGLNKMINICSDFADDYHITFNNTKSVCIKFGDKVNQHEKVFLKTSEIAWVNNIRHLGNYFDTSLTDELDCQMKISSFIGNVNKLNANFGHLHKDAICRLYKSYCCSFYGSQSWRIDSLYFLKVCTAWNKGVRRIVNVPYRTHTWMLGPLLNQSHLRYQLQHRTIRFLHGMAHSSNHIVKTCFDHAMRNANTSIGYNLALIRNKYGFNISDHTYTYCMKMSSQPKLSRREITIIQEVNALLNARCGMYNLDGFNSADIDILIDLIATD